jgi:RNA recognition motif-containing protein
LKVFVGNLSFKTTDEDLQTLFKECGEIKQAVIIRRGRRSLGYGFIEFVKHEDAVKSVGVINTKEFLGRPLKVEIARPEGEKPPRPPRAERPPKPVSTEQPNPAKAPQKPKSDQPPVQNATPSADGTEKGPAKRRQRKRGKKPAAAAGDATTTQPQATPKPTVAKTPAPTKSDDPSAPAAAPKKKRAKRAPKPVVPKPKVLSTTTLFVANLPFSVTDDSLKQIFEGLKPQSAHVVVTRAGRSRGYGFVVFENEADQLRALEAKNGFSVPSPTGEPRAIVLSISSSGVSTPDTADTTAPVETPATTTPVETK